MPRFPNRTVAVAVNPLSPDDDEDNDICPVCDGDCTCNNRPRPPFPPDEGHGSVRFAATPTASTASSARALGAQPLKIKLTVPPNIQNKTRSPGSAQKKSRIESSPAVSNGVASSNSASSRLVSASSTAGHGQRSSSGAVGLKRGRRLSKAVAIGHEGAASGVSDRKNRGNEVDTLPQSQSHLSLTRTRRSVTLGATRQVQTSESNLAATRQSSKFQAKGTIAKRSASAKKRVVPDDLTDSNLQPGVESSRDDNDDDDASLDRFPTFVSADGLTSEASDSSDSDSDSDTSGFGSDSSLAAEEENYIVAEQRRHDKARIRRELLGDDVPKHKDSNNNWVIRPRKRSVGLSDVDMEGDADDVTEDDEDEDEEMEDDEDEEDDETDGQASRLYTGLATGWSDDEESSFDADLFFANLTDTSSDDSSTDSDDSHLHDSTDPLADSITSLRSVDFEVTEAWDGQVVFTNGSNDGHGVLDLAFEANAAQLLASDSTSISHDSDVEMRTGDSAEGDFDDPDSVLGASDGDTTEEELVDERGLPTSSAMKPFRWPTGISSINPMSTVSPNVSPAPFSKRCPSSIVPESPRPADILAGKVFWEETDRPQRDSAEGSAGESPHPVIRAGIPIMGQFSLESNVAQKTAILTGANKDVPSPYFLLGHRRRRFSSSAGSFSSMDLRGRTARLSIYSSLPPPSDELSSETPLDIGLGDPIKLDDVLDSTFLESAPEMELSTIPDSEGEQRLAQSLSRWDRVPVGAFRLTRESASTSDVPTSPGWSSEPTKSAVSETHSYGNALKSSPLHTMLWNDKCGVRENPRKSKGLIVSPVLLPVRDGDRTPTHIPYHHDLHSNHRQQQHTPFKNRKESRRETKMMKRKTHAPSHQHYDHHQRHHRRNHHPNMKSRSNASVQRTYFSSPTSAPTLNI